MVFDILTRLPEINLVLQSPAITLLGGGRD
jgi:hypothetical protein